MKFATKHPLPEGARNQLIALLNQHLAVTADLFSQVKQSHWNLKGPEFIGLHKLFDELAEPLEEYADMLAERIGALGGFAMGTVRMAAKDSALAEISTELVTKDDYLDHLITQYATFSGLLHKAIRQSDDELDDPATADLFTEILRDIDKHLYFLEAHVQA